MTIGQVIYSREGTSIAEMQASILERTMMIPKKFARLSGFFMMMRLMSSKLRMDYSQCHDIEMTNQQVHVGCHCFMVFVNVRLFSNRTKRAITSNGESHAICISPESFI